MFGKQNEFQIGKYSDATYHVCFTRIASKRDDDIIKHSTHTFCCLVYPITLMINMYAGVGIVTKKSMMKFGVCFQSGHLLTINRLPANQKRGTRSKISIQHRNSLMRQMVFYLLYWHAELQQCAAPTLLAKNVQFLPIKLSVFSSSDTSYRIILCYIDYYHWFYYRNYNYQVFQFNYLYLQWW